MFIDCKLLIYKSIVYHLQHKQNHTKQMVEQIFTKYKLKENKSKHKDGSIEQKIGT